MIFNEHMDRLMEVKVVQDFMRRHNMQGKMCRFGRIDSFILYRLPYVVGIWDSLIENYLEIVLVDMNANVLIGGNSTLGCSLELGLQRLEELRKRDFASHPQNDIFLSEGAKKMGDLDADLEAIDKLLPLIEARGGLSSMRDGTFDSRFDFSNSIRPIYPGLKENYMKCIG